MIERIILSLIDHLPGILSAVAGVVTAAGILVTGILTWQNGKKVDRIKTQADDLSTQTAVNGQKADDINTKADGLKSQGDEIHGLVNGNLAKLRAQLADAIQRVEHLEGKG